MSSHYFRLSEMVKKIGLELAEAKPLLTKNKHFIKNVWRKFQLLKNQFMSMLINGTIFLKTRRKRLRWSRQKCSELQKAFRFISLQMMLVWDWKYKPSFASLLDYYFAFFHYSTSTQCLNLLIWSKNT